MVGDVSSVLALTQSNNERQRRNKLLYDAILSNDREATSRLLASGHQIQFKNQKESKLFSEDEDTPLHLAAKHSLIDMADLLIAHGAEVNATNRRLQTPLHWAVYKNHFELVALLLQHGADINSQEDDGDTPLVWAAYRGHLEMARYLIREGAKIHIYNHENSTALHWAAYLGHTAICQLLLAEGASLEDVNRIGDSPIAAATSNGHVETVTFFLGYQSRCVDGDNRLTLAPVIMPR